MSANSLQAAGASPTIRTIEDMPPEIMSPILKMTGMSHGTLASVCRSWRDGCKDNERAFIGLLQQGRGLPPSDLNLSSRVVEVVGQARQQAQTAGEQVEKVGLPASCSTATVFRRVADRIRCDGYVVPTAAPRSCAEWRDVQARAQEMDDRNLIRLCRGLVREGALSPEQLLPEDQFLEGVCTEETALILRGKMAELESTFKPIREQNKVMKSLLSTRLLSARLGINSTEEAVPLIEKMVTDFLSERGFDTHDLAKMDERVLFDQVSEMFKEKGFLNEKEAQLYSALTMLALQLPNSKEAIEPLIEEMLEDFLSERDLDVLEIADIDDKRLFDLIGEMFKEKGLLNEKEAQQYSAFKMLSLQLPDLETIDLNRCGLEVWPAEKRLLTCIFQGIKFTKGLYLQKNSLRSLPAWIERCEQLVNLNLSGNHFTSLPRCIAKLQRLEGLNLSCNPLRSISSEDIRGLQKLKTLDLSSTDLVELPEDFLEQLPSLTTLNLEENRLRRLPESFRSWLAHDGELHLFALEGNPWEELPIELFRRGELYPYPSCSVLSSVIRDHDLYSVDKMDIRRRLSLSLTTEQDRARVYGAYWRYASNVDTGDGLWAEKNIFNNVDATHKALREFLRLRYERLTPLQREQVHYFIWVLAGAYEHPTEANRGEAYCFKDRARLADALEMIDGSLKALGDHFIAHPPQAIPKPIPRPDSPWVMEVASFPLEDEVEG